MHNVVIVVALLAVVGDAVHDMSTIADLQMLGATKQNRQTKGACHTDKINALKNNNTKLEDQPYCVLVPLPARLKKWPHSMFFSDCCTERKFLFAFRIFLN